MQSRKFRLIKRQKFLDQTPPPDISQLKVIVQAKYFFQPDLRQSFEGINGAALLAAKDAAHGESDLSSADASFANDLRLAAAIAAKHGTIRRKIGNIMHVNLAAALAIKRRRTRFPNKHRCHPFPIRSPTLYGDNFAVI